VAERNSLKVQTNKRKEYVGVVPDSRMLRVVEDRVVGLYPTTVARSLNSHELLERITTEISNLKSTASPGYPYMLWGRTNEAFIAVVGMQWLVDLVYFRIVCLMLTPVGAIMACSASERERRGYADAVRVFVKNELHSSKKVQQGRYRLIMSISIVDQLVDRVFSTVQNSAEIDEWQDIPSKPGMGLNDAGLQDLDKEFSRMDFPVSSDISGWDWSVTLWLLLLSASSRARLGGLGVTELGTWNTIYHKRAHLVALSVFVFSDGVRWVQTVPGVMKSGLYTTSSDNSRMRVALALSVVYLFMKHLDNAVGVCTMGDDCAESMRLLYDACGRDWERTKLEAVRLYRSLGFEIKDLFPGRPVEFCGYKFHGDNKYVPVRWYKIAANFFRHWPQDHVFEERLEGLKYELRHSPEAPRVLELVAAFRAQDRAQVGNSSQACTLV